MWLGNNEAVIGMLRTFFQCIFMLVIGDEPNFFFFFAVNTTNIFPFLVKGGNKSYKLNTVFPFNVKPPMPLVEFTRT